MRRLLFLLALLLLTLAIGQKLHAASWVHAEYDRSEAFGWTGEWDWDEERFLRRHRLDRNYPFAQNEELVFRLRDRDYDTVYLSGDFNDWDRAQMHFDAEERLWELGIPLEPGSIRYEYVIESGDDSMRRTDPANPERARRAGRWVSEVVVGKDHRVSRPREEYDFDLVDEGFIDFQRVDGFCLGIQPRARSSARWSPELRARLSYGFSSHDWSGRLELQQPLVPDATLQFTLGLYDFTDYTDQTGVADFENTLTSWIFREDSRDYFRRAGLAFGLRYRPASEFELRAEIRSDDHSAQSVVTTAGWDVGRDSFLPNPTADAGTLRSLWSRAQFGDELNHARLEFEHSDDALLSSDFDFTRLEGQLRTRLRLGYWNHLDLRLTGGSELGGSLPVQKRFAAGGIGTVRGYRYQSLLTLDPDRPAAEELPVAGDKRILFNAEYGLGVDDDVTLVLLFDAGRAWESRDATVDLSDLSSSAGMGFILGDDDDGGIRFDLVRPLDGGGESFIFQARLSRVF